tara:strand:- start:155 stop:436 length:282 start_codon:yes stop_codon:yes gene_type:complete
LYNFIDAIGKLSMDSDILPGTDCNPLITDAIEAALDEKQQKTHKHHSPASVPAVLRVALLWAICIFAFVIFILYTYIKNIYRHTIKHEFINAR